MVVCIFYPIVIGSHKALIERLQAPFSSSEVYELASLAFAAMPYRFLQLQTDSWVIMGLIFGVKTTLKLWDFYLGQIFGAWIVRQLKSNKVSDTKAKPKLAAAKPVNIPAEPVNIFA